MSEAKKIKILTAAQSVFLRYGFRRVSMNDIAEEAGVSRPALYLLFKSKEDIFIGVFGQWVDETIAEIEREFAKTSAPDKKIERAFEIWVVRPFEMLMRSPEAKELMDCSLGFAQAPVRQSYAKFESLIAPVLASLAEQHSVKLRMSPERTAHVLASAIHGLKQTARTAAELRLLIKDLLVLSFRR